MNLIVLEPEDFIADDRVRLVDRRLVHARKHLGLAPGDHVRVGLLDEGDPANPPAANVGTGEVLRIDRQALELRVELGQSPPPSSQLSVALALPRPPTLAKVLSQASALGVKRVLIFHSRRVEKSYWDASALAPAALRRQLILGLEQSCDTRLAQIELHPRFRPFVEDRLPQLPGPVLLGDPAATRPCPVDLRGPHTLVLGPEGGFVPFELERLGKIGARPIHLGPRTLRVETAVVALVARLGLPGLC